MQRRCTCEKERYNYCIFLILNMALSTDSDQHAYILWRIPKYTLQSYLHGTEGNLYSCGIKLQIFTKFLWIQVLILNKYSYLVTDSDRNNRMDNKVIFT